MGTERGRPFSIGGCLPSSKLVLRLPASTASAASARRAVEGGAFVSVGLQEDVKLVVTELVTNAIRHSGRIELVS
jgi:anti-sigma regulatory factor (Ser/Thr protein kinase)